MKIKVTRKSRDEEKKLDEKFKLLNTIEIGKDILSIGMWLLKPKVKPTLKTSKNALNQANAFTWKRWEITQTMGLNILHLVSLTTKLQTAGSGA